MANSFGKIFTVTTFGESHGKALGVIIDGCPAGLMVTAEQIQLELDRRKPGQSNLTTQRQEKDQVQILSGIFENQTLGTPITLLIENQDMHSHDYKSFKDVYRPSHADYTYEQRYGVRDWRGGGRASSRETVARVAAGAIAKIMLQEIAQIQTLAWVNQIHEIKTNISYLDVTAADVEKNLVRCPDQQIAQQMEQAILTAKENNDSLGGSISFKINHCPAGFGAPVFNKLTADFSQALMSISATRAVEFGLGQKATQMTGSQHNDPITINDYGKVCTVTNHAGGITGGISNGEIIYGSVAFKPVATINQPQLTINQQHEKVTLAAKGRHDPCVLPRAVPIVEAMLNLVLADHLLQFSIARIERLKRLF